MCLWLIFLISDCYRKSQPTEAVPQLDTWYGSGLGLCGVFFGGDSIAMAESGCKGSREISEMGMHDMKSTKINN